MCFSFPNPYSVAVVGFVIAQDRFQIFSLVPCIYIYIIYIYARKSLQRDRESVCGYLHQDVNLDNLDLAMPNYMCRLIDWLSLKTARSA